MYHKKKAKVLKLLPPGPGIEPGAYMAVPLDGSIVGSQRWKGKDGLQARGTLIPSICARHLIIRGEQKADPKSMNSVRPDLTRTRLMNGPAVREQLNAHSILLFLVAISILQFQWKHEQHRY